MDLETFEFKITGRFMVQARNEEEAKEKMKERLDNVLLDWETED